MIDIKRLSISIAVCSIFAGVFSSCADDEKMHYAPEITGPQIGATGQSLEAVLQWRDADPVGDNNGLYQFDVYLGKKENALTLIASNVTEENFRCSELELNTTYYWKVVAKNNGVAQESKLGTFVTADQLQTFNVEGRSIMVYPGDFTHPDPTLTGYLFFPLTSGATSWLDGAANTNAILAYYGDRYSRGWREAAEHCDQLDAYGYNDWYLPAILELDAVVSENNLSRYETDEYWSSTEYEQNPTRAMTKSTRYNALTGYDDEDRLAAHLKCRCVRSN